MDWLIEAIIRTIIEAITGRSPTVNLPGLGPDRTPPPLPPQSGQPQNLDPKWRPAERQQIKRNVQPMKQAPKRVVPGYRPQGRKQLRAPVGRGVPRGVVNKQVQQVPTPVPPPRVQAEESAPPAVVRSQPTTVSAAGIHQLIYSRPVALRTIFTLSEVIRPPLALRGDDFR
jgi:hypothetical protein